MPESTYIIRGGAAGRERLRLLARVMRPTTLQLLERVGLRSGMRCLDLGCGGGDVAFELARIVGAAGRVVAIDMDDAKLALARSEAASRQFANLEFRRADIGSEDLDSGFDLVYARFLLTHLKDPLGALRRMRAALARGGALVLEDIDVRGSFCQPESAAFGRYVELYAHTARQSGADPEIGPKLPAMLADTGLTAVGMNVVQPATIEGEAKLVGPVTMECIADAVLSAGLSSPAEVDRIIAELHALALDGRTVMSLPRVVQAWGRAS